MGGTIDWARCWGLQLEARQRLAGAVRAAVTSMSIDIGGMVACIEALPESREKELLSRRVKELRASVEELDGALRQDG